MASILNYVADERRTFEERGFTVLDAMAFCQFCVTRAAHVMPSGAPTASLPTSCAQSEVTHLEQVLASTGASLRIMDLFCKGDPDILFSDINPEHVSDLLTLMAVSPRYEDLTIVDHVDIADEVREVQFAAYTITYKDRFTCVVFRGTDKTIFGWRESCRLFIDDAIATQKLACAYLERVVREYPLPEIYVCGHSKGGNAAVYAAAHASAPVRDRLTAVFNFDGPGFAVDGAQETFVATMDVPVRKYVPEEAFIGILLETGDEYRVVESTAYSLAQHDLFSWKVAEDAATADTDLIYADDVGAPAKRIGTIANEWITSLSKEDRRIVVDAVFEVMVAGGAQDVLDLLMENPLQFNDFITAAFKNTDKETRHVLTRAARGLAHAALHHASR